MKNPSGKPQHVHGTQITILLTTRNKSRNKRNQLYDHKLQMKIHQLLQQQKHPHVWALPWQQQQLELGWE